MTAAEFRSMAMADPLPDYYRRGQHSFNALAIVNPTLAERVRGASVDPFHNDALLPAFWEFIEANWHNNEE